MDRAMFVNVLIQGKSPTYPVRTSELVTWVTAQQVAFSCLRDPDGADFRAEQLLGGTMTGYIVERATRKILVKDIPETDVLKKLDTLP
jgi:hypothetical protein